MCAFMKDWIETHPFEKLPEDVKVDEDARLDYQQQREEEEADKADHFFAPSEGY